MAGTSEKPRRTSQQYVISGALALLTVCVFWQVHRFGFIKFDDPAYVTANPHVLQGLTPASVKWAFTGVHGSNRHPLTSLSHLLDVQIFGLNAGIHHIINLALHIANVLLLFSLLRRMTGGMWRSAFVAALFAVHPMRVESVVWISERKDVLSGFFWMLSLLAYWSYAKKPSISRYLTIVGFFALDLLSKPMVVTLPVVMLLLDFWPLHRLRFTEPSSFVSAGGELLRKVSPHRVFLEKLPLFMMSIGASLVTVFAQQGAIVSVRGLPIEIRLFNSALSYVAYLGKTVWPVNLAIFYPFQRHFFWSEIIAAFFFLFAMTFVAVAVARTLPYLLTGWLWFLVTLVPVIGILQVGSQALADRYTYLPSIGIYLVVSWGLADVVRRYSLARVPIVSAAILLIGALSVLAGRYASLWKSDDLLLRHALEVTKDNSSAHCTLGTRLLEEGRYEEALAEFRQALGTTSGILGGENYSEAHAGMGLALFALRRFEEAEKSLRRAIELAPRVALTHSELGMVLEKEGKWQDSLTAFEEAVRLGSDEPVTHSNLALAFFKRGRVDEAIDEHRAALRVYGNHLESLENLAWILSTDPEASRRNAADALQFAKRACELTQFRDPVPLEGLGAAQAENKDFDAAAITARKALDLLEHQGARDKSLQERLSLELELYRSGFAYRR
jgi:tetratricopeptide (TPR) repeat protein